MARNLPLMTLFFLSAVFSKSPADRFVCKEPNGSAVSDQECAVLQRNSSNRCCFDSLDYQWISCRFSCDGQLVKSQSGKKCIDLCNATNTNDTEDYTVLYVQQYCKIAGTTTIQPVGGRTVLPNSTPSQTTAKIVVMPNSTTSETTTKLLDRRVETMAIAVSVGAGCGAVVIVILIIVLCRSIRKNMMQRPQKTERQGGGQDGMELLERDRA